MNTQQSDKTKSLYLSGSVNSHSLIVILSVSIISVTIYLISHYYDTLYPTRISGGKLCDINSFLNCDAATFSPISNIFGVPIAVFGLAIGLITLSNYLIKSIQAEKTIYNILIINFIGCIALFLYSLISLGTLCPFCTVYYVLSGLLLLVFYKNSELSAGSIKFFSIYGLLTVVLSLGFWNHSAQKKEHLNKIGKSLINQYKNLENLGNPNPSSPFRIASSTEKFDEAPIQLTIFSDFQCPACKALSDIMHPLSKRYKGLINIQYFYYPLDSNCNPGMPRPMHPLACKAAYLTTCLGQDNFLEMHDKIFANQSELTADWINKIAKEKNLTECLNSSETKQTVVDLISQAGPFNVKSTPTFLLNGVKIEGVLPLNQMFILLDHLLEEKK